MTVPVCTPQQAAALLDSLKSEWGRISETERLDCMYILRNAHEGAK